MPKQDDYEDNAGVLRRLSKRVDKAYLLTLAERWLRPADQIDYVIRRWFIPAPRLAGHSGLLRFSERKPIDATGFDNDNIRGATNR